MHFSEEPSFGEDGADLAHQIDDEFVIGAKQASDLDDADCFNHSCDPNAGLRGQLGLVAMRDIAPDEQVCFDYAMVLAEVPGLAPYEFACRCGSTLCRGTITDRDWRRPELQRRYAGYFSWYVTQRIGR